jgi:uncharacterized membrane protein YfhO
LHFDKSIYDILAYFKIFSQNFFGVGSKALTQTSEWYFFYEQPVLYAGILTLILLPYYFINNYKKKCVKIELGMTIVMLALLVFPFFSGLFNMFNTVNYRWSFIFIIYMLFLLSKAIDYFTGKDHKKANVQKLSMIFLFFLSLLLPFLIISLISPLLLSILAFDFTEIVKVIVFFIIYVFFLSYFDMRKRTSVGILLAITGIELILFSMPTVDTPTAISEDYIDQKMGYYDAAYELNRNISKEDSSFFRVEKNYISQSENDNLIQNYKGLIGYNSVQNANYYNFLDKIGTATKVGAKAVVTGVDNTMTNTQSFLGVKYYVYNPIADFMYNYPGQLKRYVPSEYQLKSLSNDNKMLFENPNAYPMGVFYTNQISESEFEGLSKYEMDQEITNSVILNVSNPKLSNNRIDIVRENVFLEESIFTGIQCTQINKGEYILAVDDGSNSISITLNKVNVYDSPVLSFELDASENSEIAVSLFDENNSMVGDYMCKVNTGFFSYNLPLHENSKVVALSFQNVGETSFTVENIKVVSTIKDKNRISNNFNMLSYKPDKIVGNIEAEEHGILVFQIPYDAGWHVKVNDEVIKPQKVSYAFIGIEVDEGNNYIEMNYFPAYMRLGQGISIASIIIWGLIILITQKRK